MNPIDGLLSTLGSSQATLPADANAPDKLQPVGSGVGSAVCQTLICQKLKSNRGKICTNIYRKIVRRKLVAKTLFWQNILCTPKNLPAPTPMPAGSFTVMVCGNVPE